MGIAVSTYQPKVLPAARVVSLVESGAFKKRRPAMVMAPAEAKLLAAILMAFSPIVSATIPMFMGTPYSFPLLVVLGALGVLAEEEAVEEPS
jgi:hypothetical protein